VLTTQHPLSDKRRSVGIVRLPTQATEFSLLNIYILTLPLLFQRLSIGERGRHLGFVYVCISYDGSPELLVRSTVGIQGKARLLILLMWL
jgi:hypothetical protein